MVPFSWYLILAAALFAIGLYGALTRRNAVIVLVAIEIMMNAVNVNLVAFWRYLGLESGAGAAYGGQMFTLFSIAIAGAEAAVGLAIVIAIYRHLRSIDVTEVTELKG